MRLIEIIKQNNYETVSIIGLAKNAGKTVTLNYLIEEAINLNIKTGIASTGRDGENIDLVTKTQKPAIFLRLSEIRIQTAFRSVADGIFPQASDA